MEDGDRLMYQGPCSGCNKLVSVVHHKDGSHEVIQEL